MDDVDLAQVQAEQFRALALKAQRGKSGPVESATECVQCGQPIPEKRRMAMPGCRLCIDCQRAAERVR